MFIKRGKAYILKRKVQEGENMDLSSIGNHIKELRLLKEWKQQTLADKVGVTATYIGQIERGEKLPRVELLIDIVNALEASSDEILEEVINNSYQARMSKYVEKAGRVSPKKRDMAFRILDIVLEDE